MKNRLTGVQESIDDTRESLDDGKIVEVLRVLASGTAVGPKSVYFSTGRRTPTTPDKPR